MEKQAEEGNHLGSAYLIVYLRPVDEVFSKDRLRDRECVPYPSLSRESKLGATDDISETNPRPAVELLQLHLRDRVITRRARADPDSG